MIKKIAGIQKEASDLLVSKKKHIQYYIQREIDLEFPLNYVNIFKIFIDYSPRLFYEFVIRPPKNKIRFINLGSPARLERFLRVLLVGYYIFEDEKNFSLGYSDLQNLFRFIKYIDYLWKTWDRIPVPIANFQTSRNYIKNATFLNIYFHEKTEFENLGEDNIGCYIYPLIKNTKNIFIQYEYHSLNPLFISENLPKIKVIDKFRLDSEFHYDKFRGDFVSSPSIRDKLASVALFETGEMITIKGIKYLISKSQKALNEIKIKLDSMTKKDLEKYYILQHSNLARAIWRSMGNFWAPSQKMFTDLINENYSKKYFPKEHLYIRKYYMCLEMGAKKLAKTIENHKVNQLH